VSDVQTELDTRFSDPAARATSWEDTVALLEGAQLAWITTVRDDGRPHVTPLVTVWLDGSLHFCTGAEEQKGVNLRGNSHVVITTGCNTWDRGTDVVVEGDALQVKDKATLQRLAAEWRKKWDGQWRYDVTDDGFAQDGHGAQVFAVRPTKVLAFGKHPFSHTRHRF
jgi:general stress protein 26